MSHMTHKPIWINKSSVNPKSTSNQSSNPCTVLQYPSRTLSTSCHTYDRVERHVWTCVS